MFIIPNQESKKHLQDNKSNLTGTLYKTRNIDLDDEGYIKLASPTVAVMTEDDDPEFDTVDALNVGDSEILFNADEVFTGRMEMDTLDSRAGDTNSPTPSVEEDVIFFNETNVVSDGSGLEYESSAGVWTSVSMGLTTNVPTAFAVWETEAVLAVGNNNEVHFLKTDWSVDATTLTLPPDYQVSSLAVQGSQLFIGTRSKSGREAMMFVVGTIQVGIDRSYGVGCFEVSSIRPFKSSVALMLVNGRLVRFNGGGFDILAVLPIYNKNIEWGNASNDNSTVSNRAMTVDGDKIYINLSNQTRNGLLRILPDFPAGGWCYDDRTGSLYHRYAPTLSTVNKKTGSAVTIDDSANNFTLTSGNLDASETGMPVMYIEGSVIEGINESTAYYLIKDSSTVFRLANSYAEAIAGTNITFTGTGNVSTEFYFQEISDYGHTVFGNRMAFGVLNDLMFDDRLMGRVVMTANIYDKQSAGDFCVACGISPFLPNRGYFVLPRLNSGALEDEYTNAYLKHAPLKNDDLIILKYKHIEKYGYPFSSIRNDNSTKHYGTWTDTDTFTTTADLSEVVAGEEIEIISGVGSGHIAFVESISEASGTYTVNLTEAFPFASASDIMQFNVDNWLEAGRITADTQKRVVAINSLLGLSQNSFK